MSAASSKQKSKRRSYEWNEDNLTKNKPASPGKKRCWHPYDDRRCWKESYWPVEAPRFLRRQTVPIRQS